MANRAVLFGLLVLCLSVYLTECGRFGGGRSSSRSSSRGGSSWGKSWGGSSSWSKPSSSSWGSSGSSYKPSSSSWGSSGNSYKPSSSSGSHSYPSSSSGLSGTGSGSHSYPSGTGLSGSSGYGSHSYPSGTGLSGTGSGRYPSSSGTGSHSYPSGTGLSGSGPSKYPSSGSGSHSYPSSGTGLSGSSSYGSHNYPSGSGSRYNPSSSGNSYQNYPRNTYNTNAGYGTHTYHYVPHSYYTAPQHVYITQYRDSGSRYSDLLTGLTLYNMGRSHSHYHDHYYYDDYYRNRYHSSNNNYQSTYDTPNDVATCSLRIKENGKLEVLKIPCEIVSTFTEEGKKINSESQANHTVCTTNTTVTKTTTNPVLSTTVSPISTTESPLLSMVFSGINLTDTFRFPGGKEMSYAELLGLNVATKSPHLNVSEKLSSNASVTTAIPVDSINVTTSSPIGTGLVNVTTPAPIVIRNNETRDNVYIETVKTQTATEVIVNVTTCTTTLNYTDPLSVKGGPIDSSKMECSVDIRTKTTHLRNTVQCKTLMEYSKMPVPKKEEKPLLPPREKLKTWLEKPPWWMSMFIAV